MCTKKRVFICLAQKRSLGRSGGGGRRGGGGGEGGASSARLPVGAAISLRHSGKGGLHVLAAASPAGLFTRSAGGLATHFVGKGCGFKGQQGFF